MRGTDLEKLLAWKERGNNNEYNVSFSIAYFVSWTALFVHQNGRCTLLNDKKIKIILSLI